MAQVFLSYDRDDGAKARTIAHALQRAGHSVWWDLHVRGGAQFSKVIEEALKDADAVIVLWSRHSIESPWVRDEATTGRDTGRLIPATLDGTEPPLGFRQYQTIDLSHWKGRSTSAELRTLFADVDATTSATSSRAGIPPPAVPPHEPKKLAGRRLLVPGLAALAIMLVMVGWLYSKFTYADAAPTVSVVAADGSSVSQSLSHGVLVGLGSLAGVSDANFRLVDDIRGARPDLRISVGGIQQSGKLQATVALISSSEKTVLWSKQVEQPATQRASMDQAIALAAMAALTCAGDDGGGVSRSLGTSDFRTYLNACVSLDEGVDVQPLVSVFRHTVAAAPKFTGGWANLLSAEIAQFETMNNFGEPADAARSSIRRDMESARKIVRDMPEASVAEAALQPPTMFLAAQSLIDKAISSHPDNASLLTERSLQLLRVGRGYEALEDARRASQLRPYSAVLRANYIVTLASIGGNNKVWAELADAARLWPNAPAITGARTAINLRFGDFEKTWRAAGFPIDGGIVGYFKILHDPSDANIDGWIKLARTHKMLQPHRYFILQALGPLNRVDELYGFFEEWPMEQDLQGMTDVLFRPWTANIRRDPRFMRLAQRLGLLNYWEKSGKWPDFCAEPDMPYDCKREAAKLAA